MELRYHEGELIEYRLPKSRRIRSEIDPFSSEKYHPELVVEEIGEYFGYETSDKDDRQAFNFIRTSLKIRGVNQAFRIRALMFKLLASWKYDLRSMNSLLHSYKDIMTKNYKTNKPYFYTIRNRYIDVKGSYKELCSNYMQIRAILNCSPDVEYPKEHTVWGNMKVLPMDFPENPSKDFIFNTDRLDTSLDNNEPLI